MTVAYHHIHQPRIPAIPDPVWRPCPYCWQQGRIHTLDPASPTGYTPGPCPWCLGVGEVPSP